MNDLRAIVERAWDERDSLAPASGGEVREAVEAVIAQLDSGEARLSDRE